MPRFVFAVALLSLAVQTAHAELPPGSYDALKAKAEEAVIITVESVTAANKAERIDVVVRAKVVAVERSKAGLKKDGVFTFHYSTPAEGKQMPGPRPVPLLKKGETYPAFLNGVNNGFEPAAYGESFTMTPEG